MLVACSFLLASTSSAGPAEALYKNFQNPPASYSLMPYWYWNGRINPADTRREIQAMLAQGVRQAIAFPWDGMEPRYLSEEYWKQVGAALDIARELRFTLNFADEFDWPSGHAWTAPVDNPEISGVLRKHQEYRLRRLEYSEHRIEGPAEWRASAPIEFAVAARMDERGRISPDSLRLITGRQWSPPLGTWLITEYRLVPAVAAHNTRVDLLNRDAVRAYLGMVYGQYARRFPQHLGKTLQLTVADHEGSYGVPIAWTPALWTEFENRHHYDLRPGLPLLVHDTIDPAVAKRVRSDYLDTISQLYVDSFTGQVARWCAGHNLKHGTSLYEEQMYIQVGQAGDMFRHWRAGSVVEIDALLERARMPIDFKEAVSVAHFDRKPLLVENQGLQGHATYFSLEKARLGSNMALLWGADFLVPYFDYDRKKVTWPPQWFLSQPFWRYFHRYADYVRRAQFINAQGRHIAPVLIYYPLETAFANSSTLFLNSPHRDLFWNNAMDQTQNFYSALQLELARHGWDYHIADSYYLRRAAIQHRSLEIGDETFRVIIVPPMTDIDPRSDAKLREFERAGGIVLRLGSERFPTREHKPFMDRLNYMEQIEVPAGIQEDLKPVLNELRHVEPPQLDIAAGHIYFSHRVDGATDWYWIVNDSDRARTVRVSLKDAYEKWDAETGERSPVADELTFGPWDAFFLVRTGHSPALPRPRESRSLLLQFPDSGWTFTPESPHIDVPYARDENGNPVWLAPERASIRDWYLIGPFPFDDHRGFFTPYPPERGFDPNATYQGAFGEVRWKRFESPTYTVTLRDALGLGGNRALGVYYAFTTLDSPDDHDDAAIAAVADSMMAWCNGRKILSVHRHPKWSLLRDAWAERAPLHLRRGRNEILLKIGPSLMVPTAFMFRIAGLRPPESPRRLSVSVPPGAVSPTPSKIDPYHPARFKTGAVPFKLQSWTDSALAHYSGSALYETTFKLPALSAESKLELDLGAVGVAAEVWLNGVKCGERVWRPFTFDITQQAHAGANTLRVRVANSDAGWQAQGDTIYPQGSWGLHYKTELDRLATIRPNGLEGPVRIYSVKRAESR